MRDASLARYFPTTSGLSKKKQHRSNKRVLAAIGWALAATIATAQGMPEARIRYGVVGRSICEDYLKLLNQTKLKEPLQLCGSQVDDLPGAKPVEWEELDIPHNLELLHRIEWLLSYEIKPKAALEFQDWFKQFQRRAKTPTRLPRIQQARVVVELDQPAQLVYSYEEPSTTCSAKKLANWKKGFGKFVLFGDEIKNQVWDWKRGNPFVYGNRLHLFRSYLNDKTHFLEWTAVIETFDGNEFRRVGSSNYQRTFTCSFADSEIFLPPPRR